MNISSVPPGPRPLTAAPAYGQTITLAFSTGPGADGLALVAAAAVLKGRFTTYDYDALAGQGGAFAAQLAAGDPADTVIVALPAARYVLQVKLAAGKAAAGDLIELYRVDQGAAAGRPVAAAGDGEAFDADFAAQTFALRLKRPDGGDGSYLSLAPGNVAHLYLRSYPTTPRLGLPDPAQPERAVFFWQQAGEAIPLLAERAGPPSAGGRARPAGDTILRSGTAPVAPLAAPAHAPASGTLGAVTRGRAAVDRIIHGLGHAGRLPGSAGAGAADAGPALAAALQRSLDRLAAPLPAGGLAFNLTVASDTPCIFTLDSLALPYHLRRTTFPVDSAHPDGQAKQILRFAGDRVAAQTVKLALPAAARAVSATLQVGQSLGPGGLAAGEAQAAALATVDGVTVGSDGWTAQPFTPPAALNASGVALGLLPLAEDTELSVEVHASWQGSPAGQKLAGGTLKPAGAGQRAWVIVRFAGVAVLPAQPHWLLLRAARGQAVWLACRDAAAPGIQVLEQAAPAGPWTQRSAIPGLVALYRLLADQEGVAPAAGLALAGQALNPSAAAGENLTFELAAALNGYLGGQAATGLVNIPLTFTCATAGRITVYPPTIVYDL